MKHSLLTYSTLPLAFVMLAGCSRQKTSEPLPNILWLTAEDIGPAFGCYGDPQAKTPNIDQLAKEGIVFTDVYATAAICAPARSALITGIQATSLGTQHLRSEIPVPDSLKILPEFLRKAGYYCTNNDKTDYNFDPAGRWDENGRDAHWKHGPKGTPFFSVFNFGITHEGNTNRFEARDIAGLTDYHDPAKAQLPPYYPDTPEMRTIWAHLYDLITKFDMQLGEKIKELKDAGEMDNTIIFVFADHGYGMPRYKRWCYKSGMQVPLVVYVPDKYKSLFETKKGTKDNKLISFADFAPTVMSLAGLKPAPAMQGVPFAGKHIQKNEYIYGARSRADDAYDISRLISDGRYEYIHNFMPYKPYIQKALIFGDEKRSYRELNALKDEGRLNDTVMRMYRPKDTEELYDLNSDPYELNNLASDPAWLDKKNELKAQLMSSLIEKKDIGFLYESEMMIRSEGSSPYEIAQDPARYDADKIIHSAFLASVKNQDPEIIAKLLKDDDSGVVFWGLNAVMNSTAKNDEIGKLVEGLTGNSSPAVAILASEIVIERGINKERGLGTLARYLKDDRPTTVLDAAISIRRIGGDAKPILPDIIQEAEKCYGNVGDGYKNWMYPMFIGFALDQARINCGQPRQK